MNSGRRSTFQCLPTRRCVVCPLQPYGTALRGSRNGGTTFMSTVTADMLIKQSMTVDERWSFSLRAGPLKGKISLNQRFLFWCGLVYRYREKFNYINYLECGQRNRYSDCLWAERLRGRSSSPDRVKNFLFSTTSKQTLRPKQPISNGSKAAGTWSWPLTSNQCRDQENVKLYIHSPIHLHGVVLN
jgi:hypothetical protein